MSFPKVKICGVTQSEIARVALEEGSDFIGSIFYDQSPRFVTLEKARLLLDDAKVPSAKRVAVAVDPDPEELACWKLEGFSFFQLHFPESLSRNRIISWSQAVGRENLWLAPKLSAEGSFPEELLELADTFLIDAFSRDQYGGTGQNADWVGFASWKNRWPSKTWVLAGGLSPNNVLEALSSSQAEILDANSGLESSPGIKDPDKVRDFFSRLQAI
ncbi:MAG: phosphoribosylanthranilate isomerase [Opitutae bacterium]|nr:phosphoribosylanthranilate isomerase [Opitutae bacterium]|tara:strand:+ start:1683 stop:2330 length:648 start_codon:yes stop_codon:yes gene_type:complete